MDVLEKPVSFEETIKGSRFLSELILCETQSQARELIKAQKQKYADATHVVHAFILGSDGQIMGMSDDGEPSGTAGRPVLDVLKGRGCTNTLLTVTRWFGGTLLGTGGLVKAYSGGAKEVIKKADDQKAFAPLIQKKDFNFTVDYSLHKTIKKFMENYTLYNLKEDFGTGVEISGQIEESLYDDFSKKLKDLSNGKIDL
jgi:uncharacterized YigZ family protein